MKNEIELTIKLTKMFLEEKNNLVFLCIGSDRVVSDSFGPITSEYLVKKINLPFFVYGSTSYNITTKNIENVLFHIKNVHNNKKIVIIDACIGELCEIGQIKFNKLGCFIRKQNDKSLYVGDYSILGITSTLGISEKQFLRNTKLKQVINMANTISKCINEAYKISMCI